MRDPLLKVSDLKVELSGNVIIRDLSFELLENETLVILGPNGAGKTVLLRVLLGLLPYKGKVSWRRQATIGYVPQRVSLDPDLPVSVADFFELKGVTRATASAMVQQVGLTQAGFLDKPLGTLSTGQFQRVLIAWALVNDPDVLLFDEPTAGIDVGGEDTIHHFLHDMQRKKGVGVILVTHDLTAVYGEATHVLCMNQTKVCYGSPTEVLDPRVLQDIYGREIKFFGHSHD